MSFRYIGSKARVVEGIMDRIGEPDGGTFVDAFCGTGETKRHKRPCPMQCSGGAGCGWRRVMTTRPCRLGSCIGLGRM